MVDSQGHRQYVGCSACKETDPRMSKHRFDMLMLNADADVFKAIVKAKGDINSLAGDMKGAKAEMEAAAGYMATCAVMANSGSHMKQCGEFGRIAVDE